MDTINLENNVLQRPKNIRFRNLDNENIYQLSWDASQNAQGYDVYLDDTKIASTTETAYVIDNEMKGYVKVMAYNQDQQVESDLIYVHTVPNVPAEPSITYTKNDSGYNFNISFLDNSTLEQGYRVKYAVDNQSEQVIELQDDYKVPEDEIQDPDVGYKLWKTLQANLEGTIIVNNGLEGTLKHCLIEGKTTQNETKALQSVQAVIRNNEVDYAVYANQEDKTNNIPLNLNGFGGVKDTLRIEENGTATFEQNILEYDLSKLPWSYSSAYGGAFYCVLPILGGDMEVKLMSDNIVARSWGDMLSTLDTCVAVRIDSASTCSLMLRIEGVKSLGQLSEYFLSNSCTVKCLARNKSVQTIPTELVTPVLIANGKNNITLKSELQAPLFSVTVPVKKPPITTTVQVPSIHQKVSFTLASYNGSGEYATDPINIYVCSAPRWAYLTETQEVLLAWVDNFTDDTTYKVRYSIDDKTPQYLTLEGDGATTGREIQCKIPLSSTSRMQVSICCVTLQEGIYSEALNISKSDDLNLLPPKNFTYKWTETDGVMEVQWEDIYDSEREFEFVYTLDNGQEVKTIVPTTNKEGLGDIYTQRITVPLSSTCRAKVRMNYDLNSSAWATLSATHLLDAPLNVSASTEITKTTITWDAVDDATGYKVYLDAKLLGETAVNSYVVEHDLYGALTVVAFNKKVSSPKSQEVFIKTMPNKALWVEVKAQQTELGNDITVEWTDNSVIETHYRVEYTVDDGSKQSVDVDTENMQLPPNAVLDEDKTYLMWQDIEKSDGTDIEINGVQGEEIKNVTIKGNTDTTSYYPMSVGTVDPLSVGVNDVSTPIRFETVIKSSGEEKEIVDVARFQDINIVIEGKTVKDTVNNTLHSVKPIIYNKKGIAHTITLDHCKGKSEIRYDKLVNREEYGCILGSVGNVVDKCYKDRVVYYTKQYDITGKESWQVDNTKTNGTYTVITNVKFDNCPTYGEDEVFHMFSNKFTAQSYDNTAYSHLKCMYTDKVHLMLQNSVVGITGTDSTAMKITKCKNYLTEIAPSIRYEVEMPVIENKVIGLFVGDSFTLNHIGDLKDVCDTKSKEVRFNTSTVIFDENSKISIYRDKESHIVFSIPSPKSPTAKEPSFSKCNLFEFQYACWDSEDDMKYSPHLEFNNIYFTIPKSKLSTPDLNGIKNWLKNNHIKIVYDTGDRVVEKINILQDAFVVDSQDGGDRDLVVNNYHFDENEIIKDGLIYMDVKDTEVSPSKTYPSINIGKQDYVTLIMDFNIIDKNISNTYLNIFYTSSCRELFAMMNRKYFTISGQAGIIPNNIIGTNYRAIFEFDLKNGIYKLHDCYGNRLSKNMVLNFTTIAPYDGLSSNEYGTYLSKKIFIYNRRLSPQEIKHNEKILFGDKTFLLSDGQEKAVSGGIESGFLSGVIEGQTVKNYCPTIKKSNMSISGLTSIDEERYLITLYGVGTFNNAFILYNGGLEPNKKYKVVLYIHSNTMTSDIRICGDSEGEVWTEGSFIVKEGETGVVSSICKTKSDLSNSKQILRSYSSSVNTSGELVYSIIVIDENAPVPTSYIQFGLNSTQAIININDQEYPIYNPIIQGETKVLRTLKGTQNWEVISAYTERDTTKYDYKLSSLEPSDPSLPKLGSVPSTSDVLDLVSGELTTNVSLLEITPDIIHSVDIHSDEVCVHLIDNAISKKPILNQNSISVISTVPINILDSWEVHTGVLMTLHLKEIKTVQEWNDYLIQQKSNGTPVTICYQLATPIQTQLTEEQLKAYQEHKRIIELNKVGNIADEFIFNEDGSGTWIKRVSSLIMNDFSDWSIGGVDGANDSTNTESNRWFSNIVSDMPSSYIGVSNVFAWVDNIINNQKLGIGCISNGRVQLRTPKDIDSSQKVVDYINSKGRCEVYYGSKNTIITHIPKHLMPNIQIQQNYQ